MKKIVLSVMFICISRYSFPQSNNLDSLLSALKLSKKEDTTKLALINQIAVLYVNSDFIRGNQMADSAISLALKLKDKKGLADAYCAKGINRGFIGYINESMDTFQKAFTIYSSVGYNPGIARSLNLIGNAYTQLSHSEKGLPFQLRALKIAEPIGDQTLIGNITINLGTIYKTINNIPLALEYYEKALSAFEKTGNKKGIARVNGNIGNIYISTKDPQKGIEYVQKACNLFREINDRRGLSINIHNMGVAYKQLGSDKQSITDYEKAVKCFNESLEIDKAMGSKSSVAMNIDNLGQVYNETKDYDRAIPDLKIALAFNESENINIGIARNLTFLSNSILFASTDILSKNGFDPASRFKNALAFERRAIRLSGETQDLDEQTGEWKNLALIYEKQKKFDSALYAYKQYHETNDKYFNLEKSYELTRKSAQYEYEKKEAWLKAEEDKRETLAALEISRQKIVRNGITGGVCILVLASLTSFIFYKRRRDARQKQKEAEFNTEISDIEMKALRAQMNPHFIFNSLNSISDYISKNNLSEANNYLVKFAKLMRSILENSEQKEISVADDLKALELYIQLESLRLGGKFTYEINVDPSIDIENTQIPPLILQPFVENSIWHGIADKEGHGKIIISIKKENNMISCIVEDNGIGMQSVAAKISEKKSLGMKITRSRIDIINKLKKANASIELTSLHQGTRAEVKLPLELSF